MAENTPMTPADMSAVLGNRWGYPYGGSGFGFGGGDGGLFAILLIVLLMGGGNAWGFGNRGQFGTEAIQNQMQQGFDNQNTMANQREILAAVNQNFHDNLNVIQDKYGELTRDIYGVSGQVAQVLANQNACCCDTKMLIQETSAQNRYDALKNTNDINAVTIGQTQKILDAISTNKIEALQGRINQLELNNAVAGVVRYPTATTYTSGMSPFCNCNSCGCGF
jgi:hypothetical protein